MEHHHDSPERDLAAFQQDPRLYQIASLGALLLYGLCWLHFDLSIRQAGVTIATALLAQYAWARLAAIPFFDPKSAWPVNSAPPTARRARRWTSFSAA